jgi:predicted PurR-regulated permease PerM
MLKKRRVTIDISIASIFWILVTVGAIYFFATTYNVLILLFAALIISFSISPLVQKLETKRIPRGLSSIVILVTIFSFFGFVISTLITPIVAQTQQLIQKLPDLINKLLPYQLNFSDYYSQFSSMPGKFVNIAVDTFSGLVSALAVIVMSYYLLQERPKIEKYLKFWFAEKSDIYYKAVTELERHIGNWFRGQLLLMFIIGVLAYLGFTIIGIPYALPLALIAGLTEIVPNIGPIIATIPAIIVGFSISPAMGIGALVVAVAIHQLENNLITPTVMKHAAGLNPIVTIIAIMMGLKIGGPLMSVLAIPLVLSIRVVLTHLKLNKTTNVPEIQ